MGESKLRKKFIVIGCTMALAVSVFSGCSKLKGSDKTVTGNKDTKIVQVSKVDGKTVTAIVGELADMSEMKSGEKNRPSGAPGNASSGSNASDGEDTPPEKPDGSPKENESGDIGSGKDTPPENHDGGSEENESGDTSSDKGAPPDMPDGKGNGDFSPFTATEDDEITFNITDDTKITVESRSKRGSIKASDSGNAESGVSEGKDERVGSSSDGNGDNNSDDKEVFDNDKNTEDGTIDDITTNSILEITLDGENNALTIIVKAMHRGKHGGEGNFGENGEVTNGTAKDTISEEKTVKGESYTSDGDDENSLRVDGAKVTLDGIELNKTGGSSSNTENGDFYGQNAGLLALNGANVTITDEDSGI